MSQINDLSGDEEKYIQDVTGLVSFGIFKFLVVPYLKDLNEMRKAYFKKATQQKKERFFHRQTESVKIETEK